jgi:membrane associated rhomboid family serine protease
MGTDGPSITIVEHSASDGFGATPTADPTSAATSTSAATPTSTATSNSTATRTQVLPPELAFALEWGAIPCEVIQRRPLTEREIAATFYQDGDPTACHEGADSVGEQNAAGADSAAIFPAKRVLAAIVFSIFLHDGWFHLGLNMLFLWVFGNNIEDRLGPVLFLAFYVVSGVVGTVAYVAGVADGTVAILGASGAVAGVMGSYLVWYPDAPIRTLVFLILVDIRARWFLGGWFAIQFFTWQGPGSWIAHVAGFVFGVITGRLIRRFRPRLADRRFRRGPSRRVVGPNADDRPATPTGSGPGDRVDQSRVPGPLDSTVPESTGADFEGWDTTGGAGHGPYPHLDEVWIEPHPEHYRES